MQPATIVANRFVIEDIAGTGGMGTVYRAFDRELGQHVALKILAEGASEHRGRFAEEARILSDLAHPGVVRWIAHGEDAEDTYWLALEWLDGEDLAAKLARGPLTVEETLAIGLATANALASAHAYGVIHRDIKPSNIFLVDGNPHQVKILDFGVARRTSVTRAITRSGVVVGTIGYIPPEQVRGEPTDARVDVFGLGAVLFECLAGQPAFAGGSMMTVLTKLLMDEPPLLRSMRDDIPATLDTLIASMLAKTPSARPIDGSAVADAIRNVRPPRLGQQPTQAERNDVGRSSTQHADDCIVLDNPSPFVGRERELSALTFLFEECVAEGIARPVLVTGPGGIGKSRLCHETLRHIEAMELEAEIWTACSQIASSTASFGLLGSLVRQAGGHIGNAAPEFLRLATLTVESKPLILVLENLHWADAPSVLAIDQALGQLRDQPLFVLALARPDVHTRFPRLWRQRDVQEISLGQLAPRAAARMVQHVLGGGAEPAMIKSLVESAGGHPRRLQERIGAHLESLSSLHDRVTK